MGLDDSEPLFFFCNDADGRRFMAEGVIKPGEGGEFRLPGTWLTDDPVEAGGDWAHFRFTIADHVENWQTLQDYASSTGRAWDELQREVFDGEGMFFVTFDEISREDWISVEALADSGEWEPFAA